MGIDQPAHGSEGRSVVGERLAHAHEDDVADRALAAEMQHLSEYLAGREVAREALLPVAQKTQAIAQPTCVETQTVERPCEPGRVLRALGVVVHPHRLDGVAAAEVEQQLRRRAVVAHRLREDGRRCERAFLGEPGAERGREVRHRLERGDALAERPARDLAGAERRFAPPGETPFEVVARAVEKVCGHGIESISRPPCRASRR